MDSYTQILYQIVFGTKHHQNVLDNKDNREVLYKYISGILRKNKCFLYRINGVENHLHIATHLHPTVALAQLIKDIKIASSLFIKEKKLFVGFKNWSEGYGAFTYSISAKDNLIEYIKNQEHHHAKKAFREELIELLKEHQVEYDEKYLI